MDLNIFDTIENDDYKTFKSLIEKNKNIVNSFYRFIFSHQEYYDENGNKIASTQKDKPTKRYVLDYAFEKDRLKFIKLLLLHNAKCKRYTFMDIIDLIDVDYEDLRYLDIDEIEQYISRVLKIILTALEKEWYVQMPVNRHPSIDKKFSKSLNTIMLLRNRWMLEAYDDLNTIKNRDIYASILRKLIENGENISLSDKVLFKKYVYDNIPEKAFNNIDGVAKYITEEYYDIVNEDL